ncbi:MAG: universal stress protein [Candidatus Thorarchaeota archaeon]|jgi:nucleotide-binding universal stress UspA family protein
MLAVDGSEGSARAATVAFEVAEMTKSKVFIIHVIPTSVVKQFSLMSETDPEEVLVKYETAGNKLLEGYKGAAADYSLEVEMILEKGSPSDRIIHQAKDQEVDLIVIGSQGMTGSFRGGVGSSAERVVLGSEAPVLVVK